MNPFFPFEWIAAIRFLLEGRAQTALTVVGASVGVAVVVFMSALLVAVQANIFTRILSAQPHIVISSPKDEARPLISGKATAEIAIIQAPAQKLRSIDQWQKIRLILEAMPGIIVVSPSVSGAAFAVRGDASKAITLNGVESEHFYKIVDLPAKITAGTARLSAGDMLIGSQLAINLGVGLGEKFHIRSANGADDFYTITGIFDLGNRGANERSVYVPLRAAQTLLGLPGGASSLDINISDPYAAETVALRITAETGLQADSWIKTFDQLFTSLKTQSISFGAIQFFVGLAVALGIASVLVVSVVQRSKEIGILRAMGASRGQILRIFLLQGAMVGLMGSLFGSAMGAGFIQLWRILARNPDGTPFFVISTDVEIEILHGIDLVIERGEFCALIGPSGSGKSTLLNIIGLLDQPTAGTVAIAGRDTAMLNDAELTHLRSRSIGFVFQNALLIPAFTALENIMMPQLVERGWPDADMRENAIRLLGRVGLEARKDNLANAMSGGQQQRVAIARALAMNPALVLADEPTGNLDTKSADAVLKLMREVNLVNGTTFLIVTHNLELAEQTDRIIEVVDGMIVSGQAPRSARPPVKALKPR